MAHGRRESVLLRQIVAHGRAWRLAVDFHDVWRDNFAWKMQVGAVPSHVSQFLD